MFHGLTKNEVKELAYAFAKRKVKTIPKSWEDQKAAGEDWLKGFRHRGGTLSLRQPEATSLARAKGFNKITVKRFFNNMKELFDKKGVIPARNMWNLDETGISTVQKPRRILAEKGVKQIGRITSGERGETVTMCACVSATGAALPPAFIYPRVHYKPYMLSGAPEGSLGLANSSGWMNRGLFVKVLQHFMECMNVSKENPHLLFMDNHSSHISIDVIDLACDSGLCIVTFSPHCSHKLQPLDVCIYGPFKRYYASYCDSWLTTHPGNAISIYDVTKMAGQAFIRSFSLENITAAFRTTGISPFNPDIFPESDFIASQVTDIPLEEASAKENQPNGSSTPSCSFSNIDDLSIVQDVRPFPRVSAGTKRSRRKKITSCILTSTPEKEKAIG